MNEGIDADAHPAVIGTRSVGGRTMDQDQLLGLLKSHFGYDEFLPLQGEIIAGVLEGRDALVLMPTGGGKSLCYQLPALCLSGITLVVSPLISLMKDQVDGLRANGIAADFINSTLSYEEVSEVRARALGGQTKILYLAPERLALPSFQHFLSQMKVDLVAVDEAHCISEWGHDFRPDYRNLKSLRALHPSTALIALTATATERVRVDIVEQLGLSEPRTFLASFNRPNLSYAVQPKRGSFDSLLELLRLHRGEPAIIYCFSRKGTRELAADLSAAGFKALPYHAGLDGSVRKETQERFIRDEVPIVVATIAFGMGIDKPDVRLVVHYDLPKSIEGYYQETGRAGRDGLPSECVLFYSQGDKVKHEYFIDEIEDATERENARRQLASIMELGETRGCRRGYLLAYFGEVWTEDNCGACDVCLATYEEFDATEVAQKVLSAVIRTGERFGLEHVIDVLRGGNTARVRELGHNRLSVYGVVRDFTADELRGTAGLLIDQGLLAKEGAQYPVLVVTDAGREFLRRREPLTLTRPRREVAAASPGVASGLEYDQELFDRLRALRKRIADERGVPPFIVFGDAALQEMAYYVPKSLEGFSRISGVGSAKLKEFGDEFLRSIVDHAHSHGLAERPPAGRHRPRRPRTIAGTTYDETRKLFEQQLPIGEIAERRGLNERTIAGHLERLVEAGEKLNLSHVLPPPERLSRIEAAFEAAGSQFLSEVRQILGEEYSYEEIGLVRLHLRLAGQLRV